MLTAEDMPSDGLDQALFACDFSREMTRTDAEFSADVIEVIINVGLAAVDDDGDLPRGFAGLAPLQKFLFPVRQSDYLKLFALRGVCLGLGWRQASGISVGVIHGRFPIHRH
jgi:hypothetical protein